MVIDAKEKTVLATSVGADERQSVQILDNIYPLPTSATASLTPHEETP